MKTSANQCRLSYSGVSTIANYSPVLKLCMVFSALLSCTIKNCNFIVVITYSYFTGIFNDVLEYTLLRCKVDQKYSVDERRKVLECLELLQGLACRNINIKSE